MPYLNINGCRYHYQEHGHGEEALVLSHGLLWSEKMFHYQVDHFKDRYRIITYDHRGQGQSEVTAGGYDMDTLYEDAVQILEQLQLGQVHFGGLSMGGFVALRLAARRPDLVKSLILMETSAQAEPNKLKYNLLKTVVKVFGVSSVTAPVMKIMFGETFLHDPRRHDEKLYWQRQLQSNPKTIVRAVSGVIDRSGIENELSAILCPTLILVGTEDKATTAEKAEFLKMNIRGSVLKYIERAGHTACIEQPDSYNRAIDQFLKSSL